jgi:integrase
MLKLKRFKNSPNWYVRGTVAGVKIFESSGTDKRPQAEEYRLKREREIYDEAKLGKVPPATFADAVEAYIIRARGKNVDYAGRLLDHFKEKPLTEIGQYEIDKAAKELYPNCKASTLNRMVYGPAIAVLRAAARAKLPGSSVPLIMMLDEEKPLVDPAGEEHLEKLVPFLKPGLQELILLMSYTGLRTGEALKVKASDITKDGKFVVVGKTKNGDPRMVPLPYGWTYPTSGWGYQTTQGVGAALRQAHTIARLPYKDGHQLGRHTFAARFLAAGGSIKRLKEAGGWKKLAVVDDTYGHLEMTEVHEFVRGLSAPKDPKAA